MPKASANKVRLAQFALKLFILTYPRHETSPQFAPPKAMLPSHRNQTPSLLYHLNSHVKSLACAIHLSFTNNRPMQLVVQIDHWNAVWSQANHHLSGDASARSAKGPCTYSTSPSHSCQNMPPQSSSVRTPILRGSV